MLYFYYWYFVCAGSKVRFTVTVDCDIRDRSDAAIYHEYRDSTDMIFVNCNWFSTRWQCAVKLYCTCIINNYMDVLFEQIIYYSVSVVDMDMSNGWS
jgi:hypothetical protein